jgi:outer membrane protein
MADQVKQKRWNVTKKILKYGLLLVLLFGISAAYADTKLGFVNAGKLLEESPQAQVAAQRIKDEFSGRDQKLVDAKTQLDAMQTKLKTDGDIMSESKRKQLRLDILARQRDVMRDEEVLRQDLSIRRSELIGSLQDVVRMAIEAIGKAGDYDIIFYDAISYGKPELDITQIVLEELKKPEYAVKSNNAAAKN